MRSTTRGFAIWGIVTVLAVLTVAIGVGYGLMERQVVSNTIPTPRVGQVPRVHEETSRMFASPHDETRITSKEDTPEAIEPDDPDSLSAPQTIASTDGKTHFVYGAPAGHNNKETKYLIVSLPGHGTTAEEGYQAWSRHLTGEYALAEFDWWKGTGEKKSDYYTPAEIVREVRPFLVNQGYDADDVIILHGFSRGSANTYAVIVQDHLLSRPVFDAVISNAGKYQSDFPLADKPLSDEEITKFYTDIPWVLVCGGLDPNPSRDGCPGMTETKEFLTEHGANVLALLTDPNASHGVFHMSPLDLPQEAFTLIKETLRG